MAKLTVVAEATAKPGKEDDLRKALLALIEPTRREKDCIQYDLHESTDIPGRFLFYETWPSREALDKHMATPHFENVSKMLPDLVDGEVRIDTFTRIA
jgi:quinol monooxygenase YgiN